MVLRKICNFAKIAPFQLNILNLVKRLFYVIFVFLDSSYYKVQHIKIWSGVIFSFGTIWVEIFPIFKKVEISRPCSKSF